MSCSIDKLSLAELVHLHQGLLILVQHRQLHAEWDGRDGCEG